MSIVVSGGLKPSTADTPLDLRTRCDTLAEIANIENAFVGALVYCKATGKLYRVKTLTETKVGVITTYRIGEYEALPDLTDISGLSGRLAVLETARNDPAEIIIDIAGLTEDNRASLIIELCEDAGFAEDDVTVYDSATEDGNGAFLGEMSMEEMIDFCAKPMAEHTPGLTAEEAKARMRQYFPELKRWKK